MFYRDTRGAFKLPEGSPNNIAGSIISVSGIEAARLLRRPFKTYSHLQRRLIDPQLYLAGLPKEMYPGAVARLVTYPWFVNVEVPNFATAEHGKLENWQEQFGETLFDSWPGTPADNPAGIRTAIQKAVDLQVRLECESIILPGTLTRNVSKGLDAEMAWLDTGLSVTREVGRRVPVFASLAITQDLLSSEVPENSRFLDSIADQFAAREVDGVYLVMAQTAEQGYSLKDESALTAILMLIDDLARVAKRRVIVNHLGPFGAVTTAAGAEIWATDYYLSRRRLVFSDLMEKSGGSQMPRYFSTPLMGDLGVEHDLDMIAKKGLFDKVRVDTWAAKQLHEALRDGRPASSVYAWQYERTRTTAAKAHYLTAMDRLGRRLANSNTEGRITIVHSLLQTAASLADALKKSGVSDSYFTELGHQEVWLRAYERFLKRRQQED